MLPCIRRNCRAAWNTIPAGSRFSRRPLRRNGALHSCGAGVRAFRPRRRCLTGWLLGWPLRIARIGCMLLHGLYSAANRGGGKHRATNPRRRSWRVVLQGVLGGLSHRDPCVLCGLRPGPDTLAAWDGMRARFAALTDIFLPGAEGYLLACRLRETLSPTMPDAVDRRGLTNQREALFGHPMTGGGIVGELLEMTDELLYRGQQEDACAALDD